MLEAVRGRRGAEDALPDGDLYMFLDGGRGIMDRMASHFISKTYVSKTIHLHLEPGSVTKRLEQVRGAAVHNTHETMNICASQWPKSLRSRSRRRYSGSTATHGLGPIVLPDVSSLWHVLRPVKEDMYGKRGLIPVGGRAPGEDATESETEEPGTPTPPHPPPSAGTSEPVAWHSMPELFWHEILCDFRVGAVIDLTPGDGPLAGAALHARIPYTGLVFARRHADELLRRLQSLVIAGRPLKGTLGTTRASWNLSPLCTQRRTEKKSPKKRHSGDGR